VKIVKLTIKQKIKQVNIEDPVPVCEGSQSEISNLWWKRFARWSNRCVLSQRGRRQGRWQKTKVMWRMRSEAKLTEIRLMQWNRKLIKDTQWCISKELCNKWTRRRWTRTDDASR